MQEHSLAETPRDLAATEAALALAKAEIATKEADERAAQVAFYDALATVPKPTPPKTDIEKAQAKLSREQAATRAAGRALSAAVQAHALAETPAEAYAKETRLISATAIYDDAKAKETAAQAALTAAFDARDAAKAAFEAQRAEARRIAEEEGRLPEDDLCYYGGVDADDEHTAVVVKKGPGRPPKPEGAVTPLERNRKALAKKRARLASLEADLQDALADARLLAAVVATMPADALNPATAAALARHTATQPQVSED